MAQLLWGLRGVQVGEETSSKVLHVILKPIFKATEELREDKCEAAVVVIRGCKFWKA